MTRAERRRLQVTLKHRRYIHAVLLAVLPIVTAAGIMTEEQALLWATLLGTVLVPGLALSDNIKQDRALTEEYEHGREAASIDSVKREQED